MPRRRRGSHRAERSLRRLHLRRWARRLHGAAAAHEEVLLHIVLLVGAVRAVGAQERLLPGVDAQVPLQVVLLVASVEGLVAQMAPCNSLAGR